MTQRTYKRLTNVCFWIVIASAFFFDRAGSYTWLLGSAAVAAVLVAGSLHISAVSRPLE